MPAGAVRVCGVSEPGHVPPGLTLQNWQTVPHLHWAFQHLADFLPTARISRGTGPVAQMPARAAALSDIVLPGGTDTVGDVMGATATDGWIVTRHGEVLEERYPAGMLPDTPHLLMSVSKTLVATVAGVLIGEGALAPDALLSTYVPALAECGYAGATVRHLLDMRSGIAFSEDYLDPLAEVRLLEQAIGWAPRTVPDLPDTMYGFLLTLRRKSPHGGPFDYRSCETDVLGWVCEAAGGTRMPTLMSDLLWSRIGAQADAVIGVDREGTGMFDGGINACLRDLVRVGTLFLNDGVSLTGSQVVTPSWIADTLTGGADSRDAFAAGRDTARFPGGMYRNKCWLPYPGDDVVLCLGIHGQMIYVNRPAGVVAAKLSSWALPEEDDKLRATIAAFDAIAAEFR
ncbi:hydrolase [Mycobacterium sp. IS-1496]|uniref:serine hydrolase domain-containing protein n=1 Tax=Mycobacterium sp. IS-1496 TaxID=1772284 RepID=UPI0007416763|nr:serine hydrolase [Mycobacterium sp. IS-1496]KUI28192.1 hydrolase [Mycobacterium sp. IS-1496]